MSLTLDHNQVVRLREVLNGVLPSITHSEVFSAQCVNAILQRLAGGREKSAEQEKIVANQHCLRLYQHDTALLAQGKGVSDKGCHVTYRLLWTTEPRPNSESFNLDPHALFYTQEAPCTFEITPATGPLAWAQRQVREPGARPVKTRVRRLHDEHEEVFFQQQTDIAAFLEQMSVDVTDEAGFLRTLTHFATSAEDSGDRIGFIKSAADSSGQCVVASSWKLEGKGHAFVRTLSRSHRLPPSRSVFLTYGMAKTLRWLFDLYRNTLPQRIAFDTKFNQCYLCFLLGDLQIEFCVQREESGVVRESPEAALRRIQFVVRTALEMHPHTWTPPRSLVHLSEGLSVGASFAVPQTGQEEYAGVRVETDSANPQTNWLIRARNLKQSAVFRLGEALSARKHVEGLNVTSALARSLARTLDVFINDYKIKESPLRIIQGGAKSGLYAERAVQMLTLQTEGPDPVRAGVLCPVTPDLNMTFGKEAFTANKNALCVVVSAEKTIQAANLALTLATLPGLNRGGGRGPLEQLAQVVVKKGKVVFEAGSSRHVAGAHVAITGIANLRDKQIIITGNGWISVQVPSDTLQQFMLLLERVRRASIYQDEYGNEIAVKMDLQIRMYGSAGGNGLFIILAATPPGGPAQILARISTLTVRYDVAKASGEADLPTYYRYSPSWTLAMPETHALPSETRLTAYAALQRGFAKASEEPGDTAVKQALTAMQYDGAQTSLMAGTTHHFLEWKLENPEFGTEDKLIPPGFLDAASVLRRSRPEARYALEGDWCYLQAKDAYAVWHRGVNDAVEKAFPREVIRKILHRAFPSKPVDPLTGLVSGTALPGEIRGRCAPSVLLERIASIEGEGPYGRLAWIWNKEGLHQLVAENVILENGTLPAPMLADVDVWETEGKHFFLCVNMNLLKTQLKALGEAEKRLEIDTPDISVSLHATGIQLTGERYTTLILPMTITDKETTYLSTLESMEGEGKGTS